MAAEFDSWRPAARDVVAESDWKAFCSLSPQSSPLVLPSADDEAPPTVLPLFGAASASTAGTGLQPAEQAGADGMDVDAAASGSAAAPAAAPEAAAAVPSGALSKAEAMDVLLAAGGPVWALDWCPAGKDQLAGGGSNGTGASADGPSYLAVGCHPAGRQQNVIGTAVEGRACIQVWEVGQPDSAKEQAGRQEEEQRGAHQAQQQQDGEEQAGGVPPPRMALALGHEAGVAWHCRWCPDPSLTDDPDASPAGGAVPRLGLLAAALGDGSVRVWAVPHPRSAAVTRAREQLAGRQQQQQQEEQGEQQQGEQQQGEQQEAAAASGPPPLVLSLPPVASASSAALGGSMPSLVEWLPSPPFDLLAVGCWDGCVAVLRLDPTQQAQHAVSSAAAGGSGGSAANTGLAGVQLLSHFSADVLPLRSLRWVPPGPCSSSIDSLERNLIATGGHEGTLRLWDLRDTFQPIYSHVLSSNAIISAVDWTSRPFGVMVAMEDAAIKGVVLDSDLIGKATTEDKKAMFSITWRGTDMGALWGLAVQPTMQVVAYGGEDGVVGVFPAEYPASSKRRMHHTPVAGLRMEGGALLVLAPSQLARNHGLFSGKVVERASGIKVARLAEEAEAVHRVAWSGHTSGSAWLASGGAAGLVRCQWIQSQ